MSCNKNTSLELHSLFERNEKDYVQLLTDQKRHEILFSSFGITPSEYRVLAFLHLSETGSSEPSVMADSLMILRQTMTKIIDTLETKGFVSRTIHPTDRRRVYVNLLPCGNDLAKQLLQLESEYVSSIHSYFSQEELDTFAVLLQKLHDARDAALAKLKVNHNLDNI